MRYTTASATLAALTLLVGLVATPSAAFAQEASFRTDEVISVSGPDAIAVALGSLRGVEVGSAGATLTVELQGTTSEIPVDYSSALSGDDGGVGLLPLMTLGVGISVTSRVIRGLSRFASRVRRR